MEESKADDINNSNKVGEVNSSETTPQKGGMLRSLEQEEGSEMTPLVMSAATSSGRMSSSGSSSSASLRASQRPPEPTLWASRLSLFLARVIPGYGAGGNLATSWSYFEYMALPRRVITTTTTNADSTTSRNHHGRHRPRVVKAPPGRHLGTSTLYPAWTTPVRQLQDFGTGVAVYFETLLSLSIVCLVAGLLYLPAIQYYASDGYTSQQINTVLGKPLRGSLICPAPMWVPCPDCPADQWKESPSRYGTVTTTSGDNNNNDATSLLVFALKNNCSPLRWNEGLNHLLVMTFLALAMFALGWYQRRMERHYDENVLTASDYSVQVDNPPANATDPAAWKDFFSQFGSVAYVTVALNNSDLLTKLQQRRALLLRAQHVLEKQQHQAGLPLSTRIKPLQTIPAVLEKCKPKLYKKLMQVQNQCRQIMTQRTFPTSAIFVTFDKEAHQRACLKALQVGNYNVYNNNVQALEQESFAFINDSKNSSNNNKLVLDVMEPKSEPSAVRWQDLDETWSTKIRERIISSLLSVGVILAGFALVADAYQRDDVGMAALLITLLNILMPHVFKAINSLESHQYEDSYQASLYWKITIFRWVNTALVTVLIKPFAEVLSDSKSSLIASVQAVLRAEIVIGPAIRMLDIGGFVKRMILAPRASNQSAMNSYFRGAKVNLGEKYANTTKTVFLVFFYAAIFPSGFFYGAVALFLTYVTDKFLLLRSWGPIPETRDAIARLSRKVFFPLTVVVLAIMSEVFISAYPFDDLCHNHTVVESTTVSASYIGTHTVTLLDAATTSITVTEGDPMYRFCDQDFLERLPALLNILFKEHGDWMGDAQESMSFVYGLFAAGMVGLMIFVNLQEDVTKGYTQVLGGFTTTERDSGESFSKQKKISAYVPQVNHRSFAFPLIAADLSKFDCQHVGWEDPFYDHGYYNLQDDITAIDPDLAASGKPILSRVYQYESRL